MRNGPNRCPDPPHRRNSHCIGETSRTALHARHRTRTHRPTDRVDARRTSHAHQLRDRSHAVSMTRESNDARVAPTSRSSERAEMRESRATLADALTRSSESFGSRSMRAISTEGSSLRRSSRAALILRAGHPLLHGMRRTSRTKPDARSRSRHATRGAPVAPDGIVVRLPSDPNPAARTEYRPPPTQGDSGGREPSFSRVHFRRRPRLFLRGRSDASFKARRLAPCG